MRENLMIGGAAFAVSVTLIASYLWLAPQCPSEPIKIGNVLMAGCR